jgi:hypothetical protein
MSKYTAIEKEKVKQYLNANDEAFDIDKLISTFPKISLESLFEIIDTLQDEGEIEIE